MSFRVKYIWWLPTLILMVVIVFVSHQSDPVAAFVAFAKVPSLGKVLFSLPDCAAHFAEYFCLALSVGYGLQQQTRGRPIRTFLIALLLVTVFAISDELHQAFIPRRSPELRDLGMDMMGAICALTVLRLGQVIRRGLARLVRSLEDSA